MIEKHNTVIEETDRIAITNIIKIKRNFSKDYQPYQIGFISENRPKIKIYGKLQW